MGCLGPISFSEKLQNRGDDVHGRIANWGESEKFRLKGIKPSL